MVLLLAANRPQALRYFSSVTHTQATVQANAVQANAVQANKMLAVSAHHIRKVSLIDSVLQPPLAQQSNDLDSQVDTWTGHNRQKHCMACPHALSGLI